MLHQKSIFGRVLILRKYWVVDVQNCRIAFAIVEGETQQITQSQVLLGLTMALLEAFQTQVGTWLLQQMQSL